MRKKILAYKRLINNYKFNNKLKKKKNKFLIKLKENLKI